MSGSKSGANGAGKAAPAYSRVLIVDDHPVVRHGLRGFIDREEDLKVVAEAEGMTEALGIIQREPIDLVVVDISLRDGDGLELVRHIRSMDKTVRALVHSMYDEFVFAQSALDAGAMGYLTKEEPPRKVIEALRKIRGGNLAYSDAVVTLILDPSRRKPGPLSPRELQVLDKMGDGLGTVEIARGLHISKKTVETHKERMKEKLGLEDANKLMVLAVRRKFELGGYKPAPRGEDANGAGGGAKIAEQEERGKAAGDGGVDESDARAGRRAKVATKREAPKGGTGRRKGG